jgi:hypothetical protein
LIALVGLGRVFDPFCAPTVLVFLAFLAMCAIGVDAEKKSFICTLFFEKNKSPHTATV